MVIVVYGEDSIRAREKVEELERAFQTKFDPTGMNMERFPRGAEKIDTAAVFAAVRSVPFLSPRRMVVVKDLFGDAKKDVVQPLLDALEHTPESTIVVVWEQAEVAAFEKKPAYKTMMGWSDVHAYPCATPTGAALDGWIAERVRQMGATMQPTAAREIAVRVGGDMVRISQELQKLVAYAGTVTIDRSMVEQMVRPSMDGDVFAFMDSLASSRRGQAVDALAQERVAGSNAFYLLSMFTRQIRLLLSARSLLDTQPMVSKPAAAEALGVHPFVAQKLLQHARLYTLDELLRLHTDAFSYEHRVKTGGMDADAAIELLLAALVRAA